MVHQYGSGRNAQAAQGETGKRQPANRDQSVYARLVSDRVHLLRRPVSGGMASRSGRYGGGGISRTDGGMRALSRSQVRSHQPARLLPPVGALRRQRGTRNSAGELVRRANQLAQLSLAEPGGGSEADGARRRTRARRRQGGPGGPGRRGGST